MKIYSIRERPEFIPAMLESLERHWPACMPWIKKHMGLVLAQPGPIPDAYIAVDHGKVVGGYTLAIKQILDRKSTRLQRGRGPVDRHAVRGPQVPRTAPEPHPHRPRPAAGGRAGVRKNLSGLRTLQLL